MTALLDHAHRYLDLGFALLPMHFPFEREGRLQCSCTRDDCPQPAKHPFGRLVRNGVKDASKDPETVERWFTKSSINMAIATGAVSGIIALDVDPRHDGDETLAALEQQHGPLPKTWRFLTGGGGEHILFRHPSSRVSNSAGSIGPGLDLRGDGGCIVAPPSRHVSGRSYAISVDHHPDDIPLADAPSWLLKTAVAARKVNKAKKAEEWRAITRDGVANGARNETIAKLSGLLIGRGIDPHVSLDLILAFNAIRCQPPLPEDEVAQTVASIARLDQQGRAQRHDQGGDHG